MLICSLLFQLRVTVAIMMVRKVLFVCVCLYARACVRACMRVCLVPDVCDDEVGGGDEEVADSLEGCADGLVNFSNTGLGDYLRT